MTAEPRVCLDLLGAQEAWTAERGIGRFITEQAGAVLDAGADRVHSLLMQPDAATGAGVLRLTDRAPAIPAGSAPPLDGNGERPAVLHVMSPFAEQPLRRVWPAWARHRDIATVVTLYDLIPLRFPERYLADAPRASAYRARLDLIRSADRVLAISQRTADDAVELIGCPPERIDVVGAGASSRFAELWPSRAAASAAVRARWPAVDRPFLFYVGGAEPRKNIEGLFRGLATLAPEQQDAVRLVVTCALPPAYLDHLRQEIASAGISAGQVVLTDHIDDRELAALYRSCHAFVFPSFYEGSGLPVLEAMTCGAPVIASRTATGPELLGSTEGTFDPADPDEIGACIARLLTDGAHHERLRARSLERGARFTWPAVAERTFAAYAEAAAQRSPRRARVPRTRHRVALVSPAPPERSGIANYTAELAHALADDVDVEVVVDPLSGAHPLHPHPGVSIVDAGVYRMRCELDRYDRSLFCMGNSAFHGHVYDAFLERPDVLLLHDVRITQFYRYQGFVRERDPTWFMTRLLRLYGNTIPADVRARADVTREESIRLGIFMTGELQAMASHTVVHSHYAAELARLDRRGDDGGPIHVLPLACRPASAPATRRPPGRQVATFGYMDEVKGITTLLHAVAEARAHAPDLSLTLAGTAEPDDLARWRALSHELGIAGAVRFEGFVTEDAYRHVLGGADVAVQLRTMTNGEASAAIADCLASGVPTVVTDLGWSAELPPDVVVRVPVDVSAHGLAGALGELLESTERRSALGERAREYARRTDFPTVARRYLDLLEG